MRNIPALTGVRGIAAGAVVAFHAYLFYTTAASASGPANPLFNYGWVGVDLFFVLSGFLLGLPLLAKPASFKEPDFWRRYMLKRWLRIAPPYYASILVLLWAQNQLQYIHTGTADVLAHVFYVHNFHQPYFGSISGVYWTLALEFQFYLILPLVAIAFARNWKLALLGSAALSLIWRFFSYDPSTWSWMALQMPAFWIHFALGLSAARLFRDGWRPSIPAGRLALAWFALFIVAPLYFWAGPGYSYGTHSLSTLVLLRPTLGLGFAGLLLLAVVEGGALKRLLVHPIVQATGQASYSVYLVHMVVVTLLLAYTPAVAYGFYAFTALVASGTVLASFLFYRLVEQPSLWLKDWITSSRSIRPTTVTQVATPSSNEA